MALLGEQSYNLSDSATMFRTNSNLSNTSDSSTMLSDDFAEVSELYVTPKRRKVLPRHCNKTPEANLTHKSTKESSPSSNTRSSSRLSSRSLKGAAGATSHNRETLSPERERSVDSTSEMSSTQNQTSHLATCVPVEIHQMIVAYLHRHRDFASYSATCKVMRDAVSDSVYRKQFLKYFDNIPGGEARLHLFRLHLKGRQKLMSVYVDFRDSVPEQQHQIYLHMIKEIIIQAEGHKTVDVHGYTTVTGLNFEFLRDLFDPLKHDAYYEHVQGQTCGSNLLAAICTTNMDRTKKADKKLRDTTTLMQILQLCLLHLILVPIPTRLRYADLLEIQQRVYRCYQKEPLFLGKQKTTVNIPWLIQVAAFFKYHLRHDPMAGEALFSSPYAAAGAFQPPRPWTGKVRQNAQDLGHRWIGSFTYMESADQLMEVRGPLRNRGISPLDCCSEANNGFQDLKLFFDVANHREMRWPAIAEQLINGKPTAPHATAGTKKSKVLPAHRDFFGLGQEGKLRYHFYGRVHALPPQSGIPGFQRVTLVKPLPDTEGVYGPGYTTHWLYEGVVIPGGQIMLGRWWNPNNLDLGDGGSYCGPFIFWCTDNREQPPNVQEALDFLEEVDDFTIG